MMDQVYSSIDGRRACIMVLVLVPYLIRDNWLTCKAMRQRIVDRDPLSSRVRFGSSLWS